MIYKTDHSGGRPILHQSNTDFTNMDFTPRVIMAGFGDEVLDGVYSCHPRDIQHQLNTHGADVIVVRLNMPEIGKFLPFTTPDMPPHIIVQDCCDPPLSKPDLFDLGVDVVVDHTFALHDIAGQIRAINRRIKSKKKQGEKLNRIRAKLAKVQTSYDSIDQDLIAANRLQQALIKDRHLSLSGTDLSLILKPRDQIGGDLVGFFPVNAHCHGFFALDVAGHGITAALMSARIAGLLTGASAETNLALETTTQGGAAQGVTARSPAIVMAQLNDLALAELESDHYFTALLGVVDLPTGQVTFSQAGHPNPMHIPATGGACYLGGGGFPVGLLPGVEFENHQLTLNAGDRFLIHSDGITECQRADTAQTFGEDGLHNTVMQNLHLSGPDLLETLIWDMTDFHGSDQFEDDISAILIHHHPP